MTAKISNEHARSRLAERVLTDGEGAEVDFEEVEQKVRDGEIEWLKKQSCSRSICRVFVPGLKSGWVYLVVNRKTRSIITVLSEAQARDRLLADGIRI